MRILIFALIILSLGACSKYDEGSPSFASKKSRLVNDWTMVKLTINGFDVTALKIITGVDIKANNTFTVYGEANGVETSSSSTWVFNGNKTQVLVTNADGSIDSYEIIKLEKDSLKLKIINNNGATVIHEYKSA
ncbi:MAG: lipocalin family protein [Crocinitomicaceae bacterium]